MKEKSVKFRVNTDISSLSLLLDDYGGGGGGSTTAQHTVANWSDE